jgi:hypothetical protein
MLFPKERTAADYRVQAAHIREFLKTNQDDRLRFRLIDVASRLDWLAREQAKVEARSRRRASRRAA